MVLLISHHLMEDIESDVFCLLRKNGLNLASHMVNILKELGYNDLRTLVQIEGAEFLQAAVVESYGDCEEYLALPEEQKRALLGPKFWRNPIHFKFLAGEKAAISSLKPLCSELLAKLPLIFPSPNLNPTSFCSNPTSLKVSKKSSCPTPSDSIKTSIPGNEAGSNFFTDANTTAEKGTMDISGKNIENHILDWCNKRDNILYNSDDFSIKHFNLLYCSPCHHAHKFTLGINGYWKATNFLQHISSKHRISNSVCNNKSNGPAVAHLTEEKPKKGKRLSGNVSGDSEQVDLHKNRKRSQTAVEIEKGATSNGGPIVMPASSLSSNDSDNDGNQHDNNSRDNEKYPVGSNNDESTVDKFSLVKGFAQEEETSEETSYKIKSSRCLKHELVIGNKAVKQCWSSVAPNLKAVMKTASIKQKKTRSEKRRSTMIRASAYDLYQFLIYDTYISSLPPPDNPSGEKVLFSHQIVEAVKPFLSKI